MTVSAGPSVAFGVNATCGSDDMEPPDLKAAATAIRGEGAVLRCWEAGFSHCAGLLVWGGELADVCALCAIADREAAACVGVDGAAASMARACAGGDSFTLRGLRRLDRLLRPLVLGTACSASGCSVPCEIVLGNRTELEEAASSGSGEAVAG
jgi:hypothetical protein